jgi:ribonuclease HI
MLLHILWRAKDKTVNIYTDSKYTYNTIHINSQTWKEQGFLATKGSPITNAKHIMALLQVATLSSQSFHSSL